MGQVRLSSLRKCSPLFQFRSRLSALCPRLSTEYPWLLIGLLIDYPIKSVHRGHIPQLMPIAHLSLVVLFLVTVPAPHW